MSTSAESGSCVYKAVACLKPLPVESLLKLLSMTQGRDKLYRLAQYFCRFLAHYLSLSNPSMEFVKRIQRLSISVGLARKLFRIGKPLDHLQTILKSGAVKDDVERSMVVGKAIGFGGWLCLDMLQWFSSQGVLVLGPNSSEFVQKNAPRLWLLGLLSSLSLNVYKIQRRHHTYDPKILLKQAASNSETCQNAKDAVQDAIDLIIPLSLSGTIQVSPGVVGLAGTVTSVLGLTSLWPSSSSKP